MTTHTCRTCHAQVPANLAHVRSVTFERVAWCDPCWRARPEVFIPTQRDRFAGQWVAMSEKVER